MDVPVYRIKQLYQNTLIFVFSLKFSAYEIPSTAW